MWNFFNVSSMSAKPNVYPATHPSTSNNPPFRRLRFSETFGQNKRQSSNKKASVLRPLMSIKTIPIHRKINLLGAPHLPLDKFYSYPFPPPWKALFPPTTSSILRTFLETGLTYGLQPATYKFFLVRLRPELMDGGEASSYQVSALFSESLLLASVSFYVHILMQYWY